MLYSGIGKNKKGVYMRDKSKRLEQMKLSSAQERAAAAAWKRVQKSLKESKPASNERFRRT